MLISAFVAAAAAVVMESPARRRKTEMRIDEEKAKRREMGKVEDHAANSSSTCTPIFERFIF